MEDEKLNKIIDLLEDDILHQPSIISSEWTLKSINALSGLILAKNASASIAEKKQIKIKNGINMRVKERGNKEVKSAPIEPVQMLRC